MEIDAQERLVETLRATSWLVFSWFILLGLASWITINGCFAELPLLVAKLPEGWALASYLGAIIQLSNIFPLGYSIWIYFRHTINYAILIYIVLALGIACTLLLGFFWDYQTTIAGERHSTTLFVLTFGAAAVDCMTTLLFLPFTSQYRAIYSTGLAIGEASTSLVAGVLGTVQSSNSTPRFSVTIFFVILALIMVASTLGLSLVLGTAKGRAERLPPNHATASYSRIVTTPPTATALPAEPNHAELSGNNPDTSYAGCNGSSGVVVLNKHRLWGFLAMIFFLSFFANGVLFAVRPYATLGYPNGEEVYKWSTLLIMIVSPLAGLVATLWRWYRGLPLLCAGWVVLSVYTVVVALFSPTPPFRTSPVAGWTMVVIGVVNQFLLEYSKAVTYVKLQREVSERHGVDEGQTIFRWLGGSIQAGSATGSLLMFVLVGWSGLFSAK